MNELPTDRRISGHHLRAVLGTWQRTGPAYVALADALRAAILSGSVPLSTRLPSERELADATGVSRTTTTATYGLLRDEGYLASRRGSGTVTTLPTGHGARSAFARSHDDEPGVVDLSMAAPSAPSVLHGAYIAALDALPRHLTGTGYAPLGLPVLREAIAAWYSRRGTPTTPDQILVTTGGQQAIHLLVHADAGPATASSSSTPPIRTRSRWSAAPARDPCPCRRVSVGSTSTCSSPPSARSPAARLPDPRPPQPDGNVARRRRTRSGARHGASLPHHGGR